MACVAQCGTYTGYQRGCRCDECAYASYAYQCEYHGREPLPREQWVRGARRPRGTASRANGQPPKARTGSRNGFVVYEDAITVEQYRRSPVVRTVELRGGVGTVELVVKADHSKLSERERVWLDELVAVLVTDRPR
jgi:hypothetical protein